MINNNGVETLYYGYTDNLGSLIALTDGNGNPVEKYAYDPWGARRDPTDWRNKDSRTSFITNRGYTGHEHLDMFAIINMNGRVYDPLTAMFFSPDLMVSSPGDWLGYNRYSYVMNNPLRYTDPSGYQPAPTEYTGGYYIQLNGRYDFNSDYLSQFKNAFNQSNGFTSWNAVYNTITNLSNSTYGGYSNGSQTIYFKSDEDAFYAGIYYNLSNNSFNQTVAGSISGSVANFLIISKTPRSLNSFVDSNLTAGNGIGGNLQAQSFWDQFDRIFGKITKGIDRIEFIDNLQKVLSGNDPDGKALKSIYLNIISAKIPFNLFYEFCDKSGAIDNMYYEGQYPGKSKIPTTFTNGKWSNPGTPLLQNGEWSNPGPTYQDVNGRLVQIK